MRFNVPLLPDEGLIAALNDRADSFHACHFSLHSPHVQDGRHQGVILETGKWIELLQSVQIRRKYLLMNSRAHRQAAYFDRDHLRHVIRTLGSMLEAGVLDGIVFADAYLLQALSDAGGEEAARLEAVPSVNCMLDTWDRIARMMDFIGSTRFRLPKTLILDRSLNRRLEDLAGVSDRCRKALPGVALELLANEGCLSHCPFKLTHDCHIAWIHLGQALDTFHINRELGCMRVLQREPWRLLQSPFIRPEDVPAYEPFVDVLKLCGRTLGPPFLLRAVDAYRNGRFSGNLMELMDAMEGTARWLIVQNECLPPDFLVRITSCSRDCGACATCEDLFSSCAEAKPICLEKP